MLRLVCMICRERIVGHDAIEAHVAYHKTVGDAVQVFWAVSDGLVLQPIIASPEGNSQNDIKEGGQ
jgi:hypothetical protein